MSAKHTTGPWVIHPDDDLHPEYSGHVMTRDGYAVADCILEWSSIEECEQIANARLIAAAPDLLEALRDCLRRIDDADETYGPDHAVTKARAAIAKATGERNDHTTTSRRAGVNFP